VGKILAICCRAEAYDDFLAIAKLIIKKDPELAVVIKSTSYHPDELDPTLSHYPLLNIYLANPPEKLPARGKTLYVKAIDKFEQYQNYSIADVSTPKTIEYEIGQPLNFNDWGEYVFLKAKNASHSENSFLIQTKDIFNTEPYFKKLKLDKKMILQQFIYTGESAYVYRVLSFLGAPLFCVRVTNPHTIKLPSSLQESFDNKTIQTSRSDVFMTRTLEFNKDVMDFASKVFNVFPEQPLQGIDIAVEKNTNKLFALEGNQGGNVWVFSRKESNMLKGLGRATLLNQFNAFDVACDILIKKTNKLAI